MCLPFPNPIPWNLHLFVKSDVRFSRYFILNPIFCSGVQSWWAWPGEEDPRDSEGQRQGEAAPGGCLHNRRHHQGCQWQSANLWQSKLRDTGASGKSVLILNFTPSLFMLDVILTSSWLIKDFPRLNFASYSALSSHVLPKIFESILQDRFPRIVTKQKLELFAWPFFSIYFSMFCLKKWEIRLKVLINTLAIIAGVEQSQPTINMIC